MIGVQFMPLMTIHYSNVEGSGKWLQMDTELTHLNGEVVGTKGPSGHSLLVDARFELPYDLQPDEAAQLQQKLEELNSVMDQEVKREVQIFNRIFDFLSLRNNFSQVDYAAMQNFVHIK